MSDPRRLRDGGGGELEKLVVDSWRDEAPSASARRRIEVAVGLAAGVTATTATVTALGASKAAQTGVTVGLTKWIGIAAVTAVVGGGAATYVVAKSKATNAPRPAASVTVEAKPVRVNPVPPVPVAPPPEASAVVEAPSESASPPASAPPAATAAAAPGKPTPTLGDELHLLDDARAALEAGDTGRALALLNRHDTEFRGGMLAPEAMALRVEVYARSGDRDSAARLGTRFLTLYGNRPQAQRVRSIVEAANPPAANEGTSNP